MNQKTTYEVTITGKLDQLPIPDLREVIWARIEGELDADMPTDDGGDTPPSSPTGSKVLHFALPGVVVIIITLFLIKTNDKTPQTRNNYTTTPTIPTTTTAPAASPPPLNTRTETLKEKAPVTYPGTPVPAGTLPNGTDSASLPLADVIPPAADNTNIDPQPAPPLVQAPPTQPVKTDSVTQKKKRGVTDITDNDYRIMPVKPDSSRKN